MNRLSMGLDSRMRQAAAAVLLSLSLQPASAAEFSVGRVEVVFPTDDWREVVLPDKGKAYGGDHSGVIQSETKLFIQVPSGEDPGALVLIRANAAGMRSSGTMIYSTSCETSEYFFAEGNAGFQASAAHCLLVYPAYTTESVMSKLAPSVVLDWLRSSRLQLPKSMATIWSRHSVATGTFLDVHVFLTPQAGAADDDTPDVKLPSGVLPQHVRWGRQLKEAVRSSVYSISGKLRMPSMDIKPHKLVLNLNPGN
jgi:hypothetical protein